MRNYISKLWLAETFNPYIECVQYALGFCFYQIYQLRTIGIINEKEKKALDTVMVAANGNQVDTGVANQVYEKINEYFQSTEKIIW